MKKRSHPWLNERCDAAIQRKHKATQQSNFKEIAEETSTVLREEYAKYVQNLRQVLLQLPKGSKKWWRIQRELTDNASSSTTPPALKDEHGNWIRSPKDKANLLAQTFLDKATLPTNSSLPPTEHPTAEMSNFVVIRQRWALRVLKNLREDTASGPDKLPAKFLRSCAHQLALPLTLLTRTLVSSGTWPECWRLHWIIPLYKKKAVYDPRNYRGVHLTPLLSKAVERILLFPLRPFLVATNAFGTMQFAFQPSLSCNDLVAALTSSWILSLNHRRKVGVYLSDISGAFDRVEKERLMLKLKACGLCNTFLNFFEGYLSARKGLVLVQGSSSDPMTLFNTSPKRSSPTILLPKNPTAPPRKMRLSSTT